MKQFLIISVLMTFLGACSSMSVTSIEERYPPQGQFVEADGAKLHYIEQGQAHRGAGPTLIFIHGASGNARDFAIDVLPEMAKTHHVIAFDRPGYGYSQRPQQEDGWFDPADQARLLANAAAELGIDTPYIIGHSLGGAVALAWTVNHGDSIAGTALLGPGTHGFPEDHSLYRRMTRWPVIGPIFTRFIVMPVGPKLMEAGVASTFEPNPPMPGYGEATGTGLLFRPHNFKADATDVLNLSPFLAAQSKKYPDIKTPLLIISGNRDRIVSYKIHSAELHKQVPHSTFVKLKNVGHMPHHVRLDEVSDLLRRFTAGDTSLAGQYLEVEDPNAADQSARQASVTGD